MWKKLKKKNIETINYAQFQLLIHIFFKSKLLIHIENRVDPGRFKPGGLIKFNLPL